MVHDIDGAVARNRARKWYNDYRRANGSGGGPQLVVWADGTVMSLVELPYRTTHGNSQNGRAIGVETGHGNDGRFGHVDVAPDVRANRGSRQGWHPLTADARDVPGSAEAKVFSLRAPYRRRTPPPAGYPTFETEIVTAPWSAADYLTPAREPPGPLHTNMYRTLINTGGTPPPQPTMMLFTEASYRSWALLTRYLCEALLVPRNFPVLPHARRDHAITDETPVQAARARRRALRHDRRRPARELPRRGARIRRRRLHRHDARRRRAPERPLQGGGGGAGDDQLRLRREPLAERAPEPRVAALLRLLPRPPRPRLQRQPRGRTGRPRLPRPDVGLAPVRARGVGLVVVAVRLRRRDRTTHGRAATAPYRRADGDTPLLEYFFDEAAAPYAARAATPGGIHGRHVVAVDVPARAESRGLRARQRRAGRGALSRPRAPSASRSCWCVTRSSTPAISAASRAPRRQRPDVAVGRRSRRPGRLDYNVEPSTVYSLYMHVGPASAR